MSQPAVKRQRNTEMLRAPSVRDVGMSMLLLLAGRASVLGLFPFGVAFFASCFDKSIAYLGITVLSIALMTSAGSAVLTKYLVAALLFWIYTRFRNKENLVLDAACVGGAVMVGGFVFLIYTYVGGDSHFTHVYNIQKSTRIDCKPQKTHADRTGRAYQYFCKRGCFYNGTFGNCVSV